MKLELFLDIVRTFFNVLNTFMEITSRIPYTTITILQLKE